MPKLPASPSYGFASYEVDIARLLADHRAVVAGGSSYLLGGKYTSKVTPRDVNRVDCSGYVRWLLIRRGVPICDGSQMQREWAEAEGLKETTPDAGTLKDNVLRLAILPTTKSLKIGHVVLILNGQTIESRGGVGPSRRTWSELPWAKECRVFVVARPGK